MKEKRCEECKYFFQHYVLLWGGYQKAGCGHCVVNRVRRRKPEDIACCQFIEKQESDGDTNE